jgi:hypothetical protein
MSVETISPDVIVFIDNVIVCLTSHWLNSQYQNQSIDTDNINRWDQRKNVKIPDKYRITEMLRAETDIIANISASPIYELGY